MNLTSAGGWHSPWPLHPNHHLYGPLGTSLYALRSLSFTLMVCPGFMPLGTSLAKKWSFPNFSDGHFYIWEAEKTTNGSAKIRYLSTFTIALWKNDKNTTIPHTNRAVSVADQLVFFTLKEDIEDIRGLVRKHKPIEKASKKAMMYS